MEFGELLESFRASDASTERLFAGESGYRGYRGRKSVKRINAIAEATQFIGDIMTGAVPLYRFKEAMSRSDFPLLFGDVLDRVMLASYKDWPVNWTNIAQRKVAPDFRTLQRFYVDGGDEGVTEVKELTEYPETKVNEGRYQVSIKKYGKRIGYSWEMNINDDLDAFREFPTSLARGARRSESRFATDMFVGPNGPDAALYTVPNGNIITGHAALSVDSLNTALGQLGSMTYLGEPILVDMVTLVVGPALEVRARSILNATELRMTGAAAGSGANTEMVVANWLKNRMVLDVNPYIPILSTSANGNTSWFLFANPSNGRPALEMDFLRGHEEPELFQKAPDALRLGGGAADPMDGSYDNDSIEYKVRHVFGGGIIDPKMTMGSNGSGVAP